MTQSVPLIALSLDRGRTNQLSLAERRLFNDLAAQAALVIDHIGLAEFGLHPDASSNRRVLAVLTFLQT